MTIQSVTSGPVKSKGYWQAIANCNHAMSTFVRENNFTPEEAAEVADQSLTHPEHGAFFEHLAQIYMTIQETYNISLKEIISDLDGLSDAEDFLLDLHQPEEF